MKLTSFINRSAPTNWSMITPQLMGNPVRQFNHVGKSRVQSVAVALAMIVTSCGPARDRSYEFALVGDNPYPPTDVAKFEALIDDVNGRPSMEWVIHLGDIQGGQPCSDELFQARFDLFQRFAVPFVYTPGDNDWFDCQRDDGGGFDEYERLDHLRSLFFPNPALTTGGRRMEVQSQSAEPNYEEFVENVMWLHGDAVYATVHLIALTRQPTSPEIAARRMDAAIAWINTAFAVARDSGSVGIFIATQVDPWMFWGLPGMARLMCDACLEPRAGLERLYPVLVQESAAFGRPVVLAVGDTHIFRVDKPLYRDDGSLMENFTRVESFGNPNVHWVRVTVDPREPEVFSFHQQLVPENVARITPR